MQQNHFNYSYYTQVYFAVGVWSCDKVACISFGLLANITEIHITDIVGFRKE